MIFEMCAVIVTIVFIILAYTIIQTLQASKHSLKNISHLSLHADQKLKQLDSTFKTLSLFGDVAEEKTRKLLTAEPPPKTYVREPRQPVYDDELIDIFFLALKLTVKYLRRN